jgi:hypothetical protein
MVKSLMMRMMAVTTEDLIKALRIVKKRAEGILKIPVHTTLMVMIVLLNA